MSQVLFTALDRLGLPDTFPDARALYARIAELHCSLAAEQARAEQERADLIGWVASGEMGIAEAAERASTLNALIPADHARGTRPARTEAVIITEVAVAELERAAVQAVRAGARDVYTRIAQRATEAAERAIEAAGRAVDIAAPVAYLSKVFRDDNAGVPVAAHPTFDLNLPAMADLQNDPARMTAWHDAVAADREFKTAHEVAGLLRVTVGVAAGINAITVWLAIPMPAAGNATADAQRDFMIRCVNTLGLAPQPLQIAIANGLGWRPGLHGVELFPPTPPAPSRTARVLARVAAGAIRQAG